MGSHVCSQMHKPIKSTALGGGSGRGRHRAAEEVRTRSGLPCLCGHSPLRSQVREDRMEGNTQIGLGNLQVFSAKRGLCPSCGCNSLYKDHRM